MIVTTIFAPSVVLGALAAWMTLAALAALAASLFRFRFSAGVALGGSRASPGITPVSYTHLTLPTNREV